MISRVVMISDGSVHIIMANGQSIACTAQNLLELFIDVYGFEMGAGRRYPLTTYLLSTESPSLMSFPGLTLAEIYEDTSVRIYQPLLLRYLADNVERISDKPINLSRYLDAPEFMTQNELLLRVFQEMSLRVTCKLSVQRTVKLDADRQNKIMGEIYNTFLHTVPSTKNSSMQVKQKAAGDLFESVNKTLVPPVAKGFISKQEYATLYNVTTQTVTNWISLNKLSSAKKDNRGHWVIDSAELPPIKNKSTGNHVSRKGKKELFYPKGASYQDVQEYIMSKKLFSDKVRKSIRTLEEAQYYLENNYREIEWDGQLALIIDISPDYFCEIQGKTNREIILSGGSPVVPNDEQNIFHIHHIGQRADSPFAVIPSNIHNGQGTWSIFHQNASNEKELHTKEFEMQKRRFWKNYLYHYDKSGSFKSTEFKNSKQPTYER